MLKKGVVLFSEMKISSLLESNKRILLPDGVYREKLDIVEDNLTLEGNATIVFDDHHGLERNGMVFSTRHSATVTVRGKNFKARGITFKNDFDFMRFAAYSRNYPDARIGTQAVALMLEKGSDNAIFENCSFLGFQDTLYVDSGTSYFKDCHIEGNVDFIFGAGNAIFDSCDIEITDSFEDAFVAAPSTFIGSQGFKFINCKISSPLKKSYFLARPWHPSGDENRCGEVVFENCTFDEYLEKAIFTDMNSRTIEGKERIWTFAESRFSVR
ncbi:MAG: hypothetical protein K6G51_02635 [Sphaerochaetaceae bacterium]|nr:hypothetical protein [Sphaerochaetaceae bacterium]